MIFWHKMTRKQQDDHEISHSGSMVSGLGRSHSGRPLASEWPLKSWLLASPFPWTSPSCVMNHPLLLCCWGTFSRTQPLFQRHLPLITRVRNKLGGEYWPDALWEFDSDSKSCLALTFSTFGPNAWASWKWKLKIPCEKKKRRLERERGELWGHNLLSRISLVFL